MHRQRSRSAGVIGAKRPRDSGCHTAAHGAAGHGHHQDDKGKHQRHRRQRLNAETADIGCFGNGDAGAGRQRHDIGRRQLQQCRENRPIDQRISDRIADRLLRRTRIRLDHRNFRNAKLRHTFPRTTACLYRRAPPCSNP